MAPALIFFDLSAVHSSPRAIPDNSADRHSSAFSASAPNAICVEELFHRGGNFDNVRLGCKMPGIQELDPRRYVLSKCLGPRGNEKGVVLTPNRQQRRLSLPKVILKRRIELHVRCVIEKQIQLNVFVPRTLQQSRVQRVRFRRNTLRIAYTVRVLPSRSFQRQNVFRITSRFSDVGSAQYFRIGPQASPSPSS